MIKHPLFNHTAFEADIALIRLDKRATMTDYVRPVCLPTERRYISFHSTLKLDLNVALIICKSAR